MATLQGVSNEAQNRGYTDAYYGRLFGYSLTEYYKGLGLEEIYGRGWNEGRLRREADERKVEKGVWLPEKSLTNART